MDRQLEADTSATITGLTKANYSINVSATSYYTDGGSNLLKVQPPPITQVQETPKKEILDRYICTTNTSSESLIIYMVLLYTEPANISLTSSTSLSHHVWSYCYPHLLHLPTYSHS